jgi:transcriptional regulator with AAA-type ATPase domain
MTLIKDEDKTFIEAVGELSYTNPFSSRRFELERRALGSHWIEEPHVHWSLTPEQTIHRRQNLVGLSDRAKAIASELRQQLVNGVRTNEQERVLYDELVVYILFYELLDEWRSSRALLGFDDATNRRAWKKYNESFDYWLGVDGIELPSRKDKAHLFAMFHQVYRAFFNIFEYVVGSSTPIADLRSQIWHSIFTHDLRRFRRSLYRTLHQATTLIMGPSGSGKELVAQAIGMSRHVPFDMKQGAFVVNPAEHYHAINISAFAKNLVESELFGHAKGSFTDARSARIGWLEACGEYGSVLLDEIGELDAVTQVKLLRVLQNRQYQRLGETKVRQFTGKIIAATNRDLQSEMEKGTFREDLYYRLCADVIETPSLAAQLQDSPNALDDLVLHVCQRMAEDEHQSLASDVVMWMRKHMPAGYNWPGNIRELEQCIRNIMIHGSYTPRSSRSSASGESIELAASLDRLSLTADELLSHYCELAYRKTKSFEKAAKILQMDRRTVRAKVDQFRGK